MDYSRREAIKLIGGAAACCALPASLAMAQSPAPFTETPPAQGAFRERLPLHEFIESSEQMSAFARALFEMTQRPPSDPRSWFFQTATLSIAIDAQTRAAKADHAVAARIDQGVWNQCPDPKRQPLDLLVWVRAYLYHFERIVRYHAGSESFALPYWDCLGSSNRPIESEVFPRRGGAPPAKTALGDLLSAARRTMDPKVETYSPSEAAKDLAYGPALRSPAGRARIGAISAAYSTILAPSAKGGFFRSWKAENKTSDGSGPSEPQMGNVDPAFHFHLVSLDGRWAEWSARPGSDWGLPPDDRWLNAPPGKFYDESGRPATAPRRFYCDHRALGVSFRHEDHEATLRPLSFSRAA